MIVGLWLGVLSDSGQSDLVVDVIKSLHQGSFGFPANAQHFAIALQALAKAKDIARGEEVYALIKDKPKFCHYPFVLSAMMTLYGSSKEMISKAAEVFDLALKHKMVCVFSAHFYPTSHSLCFNRWMLRLWAHGLGFLVTLVSLTLS